MSTKEFVIALARGARGKDAAKALILPQIFGGTGYVNAGTDLTVSGTPPLSLPNSLGKPLKAWSVDLSPYQEGSGDPSPDNVRAIHGTDKLTVWTAGKNLYNSATTEAGYISASGVIADTTSDVFCHSDFIPVDGISNLTLSGINGYSGNVKRIHCYDLNKNWLGQAAYGSVLNIGTQYHFNNIQMISGTEYVRLSFAFADTDVQLEYGANATSYVPHVAISQTVLTLPQTVYTGTIGSEGGESRDAMVDMGTLNWARYTNTENPVYYARLTNAKPNVWPVMCSGYNPTYWHQLGELPNYYAQIHPTLNIIYVRDDRYETAEAFKAGVNGGQLLYQLDPTTQFVTPSPTIPTPTGTATTWATAEDGTVDSMSVTYVGRA